MKKLFLLNIFLMLGFAASAQITLGLRDTRFASIGYTLKDHWIFNLESSVYSADVNTQNVRIYAGYKYDWKQMSVKVLPSVGMAWDNTYRFSALSMYLGYNFWEYAKIEATYSPQWDSDFGFDNAYRFGLDVPITSQVSFIAHYQNIPEYRVVEKRIRAGLSFHVENLTVAPEVTMGLNNKLKPIRVMVNMQYIVPKFTRGTKPLK